MGSEVSLSDITKSAISIRTFVFIPAGSANSTENPLSTGFSLEYPAITLHAVSPASDSTPAYLYCQVEDPSAKGQSTAESEENNDVEEDEDVIPMREMKVFVKTVDQRKHSSEHCEPALSHIDEFRSKPALQCLVPLCISPSVPNVTGRRNVRTERFLWREPRR